MTSSTEFEWRLEEVSERKVDHDACMQLVAPKWDDYNKSSMLFFVVLDWKSNEVK
jgi:hypothetical protein